MSSKPVLEVAASSPRPPRQREALRGRHEEARGLGEAAVHDGVEHLHEGAPVARRERGHQAAVQEDLADGAESALVLSATLSAVSGLDVNLIESDKESYLEQRTLSFDSFHYSDYYILQQVD